MRSDPTDLRRRRGPHVFVDDLDTPHLGDDDHHHLARALRLRAGDPMTISDGRQRWRDARFGVDPEPDGPIFTVDPPAYAVTVAAALTKGSKPELVVQKATEIGVDRIVFFDGDNSVPNWDDTKRVKAEVRLTRVAREAAMQSRQVRLPTVGFVADLAELASGSGPGPGVGSGLVRADFGGRRIDGAVRSVAIGPEGGWSDRERDLVPESVDLGPSVLRAETAALVAAARLIGWRHSPAG